MLNKTEKNIEALIWFKSLSIYAWTCLLLSGMDCQALSIHAEADWL